MSAILGRSMFVALLLAPAVQSAYAEEAAATPPPAHQRQEIWAPTEQLAKILQKYPKAVLLTREEYETLLRDADRLAPKPAPEPPRPAAFSDARYTARIDGHLLRVSGELTLTVLADGWTPVPLEFAGAELGEVKLDGEAALLPQSAQNGKAEPGFSPGALVLRGRGEHRAKVEFTVPIALQGGESRVDFKLPQAASGFLAIDLPPHMRAESGQALRVDSQPDATHVTVAPDRGVVQIVWRAAADAAHSLPGMVHAEYRESIDADQMRTEASFALTTAFGSLPGELEIPIPPECTALLAAGSDVAGWTVVEGKVKVHFQPGERTATHFRVVLQQPALGVDSKASKTLPAPQITGLNAAAAGLSIHVDDSVEVGAIALPAGAEAADPGPGNLARWQFHGWPPAAQVDLARLQPRFRASLDTLVKFKADAIHFERTIVVHEEKGQLFHLDVTLPPGEETLEVFAGGEPADWRLEGGLLRLRWSDLLPAGQFRTFTIHTRLDPAGWNKIDATGLDAQVQDARIAGAVNLSGYLALRADESFRLEAEATDQMERRDARTVPGHGEYAWFRRDAFALKVHVSRRPADVLASVTGYALPREGVLDVHAQIAWNFQHSGVRSVRVRTPGAHAAQFHFDGAGIAERNLEGDVWTITFQKDQIGAYPMKVAVQTPISLTRNESDDSARFAVDVPAFEPLDVQRMSAVWAVEANTETEIEVKAPGMNELDAMSAPALPGYAPQHRVIGVFGSLGADWHLALQGVRHSRARLATTVVDVMSLTSVFSSSGNVRTLASLQVRAAGAQFIEIALPPRAHLLSLTWAASPTADRLAIKPVVGADGAVRAPLPAQTDPNARTMVDVLYETPGAEWSGAGGAELLAPQVAGDIPVLKSVWCAYLPDGFEYRDIASNLRLSQSVKPATAPRRRFDWRMLNPFAVEIHGAYMAPGQIERSMPSLSLDDDSSDRATVRNWYQGALGIPTFVRSWKLDPADFNRFAGSGSAKEAIENRGLQLGSDDGVVYLPHSAQLVMKSSPDMLDTVEGILHVFSLPQQFAGEVDSGSSRDFDSVHNRETDRIRAKLQTLVLPKLEFRDATLRASLDYITRTARMLDTTESDPLRRGVNLIVDLNEPKTESVPSPALAVVPGLTDASQNAAPETNTPEEAKITLSLTNVPLGEALRYVTSLASLKYKVTPQGVRVVPLSVPTEVLVTREWRLSHPIVFRMEPRDYFISNGVSFPPGTSATYLPKVGKLIVKNTQENLDTIDAILQAPSIHNAPAEIGKGFVRIPAGEMKDLDAPTDVLPTLEIVVPPDMFRGGDGHTRMDAKGFLETNGVTFPPGASAIFLANGSKLIVKNTWENLQTIKSLMQPVGGGRGPDAQDEILAQQSGLLPIQLELPKSGRLETLDGLTAPKYLRFEYTGQTHEAKRLWWCLAAGGVAFFLAGPRRWGWKFAWAVLALSALPWCIAPEYVGEGRAALAGWALALVLHRISARCVAPAHGKESLA